jgi:signal transduction histidine kinase
VLVLAVVALEVPLSLSLRRRVDLEVRSQARNQAEVLAATAADLLAPLRMRQLATVVASSAASVRGRVIVVDRVGRLVLDSAGTARLGDPYRGRPEISAALAGRPVAQLTRRSAILDQRLLATAVPVRRGAGPPIGAVRITQSVAAVDRAVRRATLGLALIGLLVLALGLAAGAVIARQIVRPLRRLDGAARRFAHGDLEARAPVEGSAEQRSLARTFNDMTARIGSLVRSRQDFVADASHQLRTPLTGLRLRLEEARGLAQEPAAIAELDAGMHEVDRLAQVVDELLVLSRAGERELPGERVDLAAAAHAAAERWRSAAGDRGQSIEVSADGAGEAWCARADLERILDVLVENAVAYGPEGGTVRLRAAADALAVQDEGAGPAPGEEEAVFERFHRGAAGRAGPPGTGLGLAIARELAHEWGADVTLARAPGGGGVATVRFGVRG